VRCWSGCSVDRAQRSQRGRDAVSKIRQHFPRAKSVSRRSNWQICLGSDFARRWPPRTRRGLPHQKRAAWLCRRGRPTRPTVSKKCQFGTNDSVNYALDGTNCFPLLRRDYQGGPPGVRSAASRIGRLHQVQRFARRAVYFAWRNTISRNCDADVSLNCSAGADAAGREYDEANIRIRVGSHRSVRNGTGFGYIGCQSVCAPAVQSVR